MRPDVELVPSAGVTKLMLLAPMLIGHGWPVRQSSRPWSATGRSRHGSSTTPASLRVGALGRGGTPVLPRARHIGELPGGGQRLAGSRARQRASRLSALPTESVGARPPPSTSGLRARHRRVPPEMADRAGADQVAHGRGRFGGTRGCRCRLRRCDGVSRCAHARGHSLCREGTAPRQRCGRLASRPCHHENTELAVGPRRWFAERGVVVPSAWMLSLGTCRLAHRDVAPGHPGAPCARASRRSGCGPQPDEGRSTPRPEEWLLIEWPRTAVLADRTRPPRAEAVAIEQSALT